MKSLRLLSSFNKRSPLLFSQSLAAFSSSSSPNPRFSNSFFDDAQGGSAVYEHKLKFQRPRTITWSRFPLQNFNLENFASFIGSVIDPLRILNSRDGGPFRVYTLLSVRNSSQSNSTFRILLTMSDEMAELSFKHLKPNDFIYVSGELVSSTKADPSGPLRLYYKLVVKELNYVAQPGQGSSFKNHEEPQSNEDGTGLEKYKDRLHLWQVFFTNPYEWWDNRKRKRNPRQPDFKHKDTGEALWLRPDDPSWIKRQIQLLDLRMEEQGQGEQVGYRSRVSKWEYDE